MATFAERHHFYDIAELQRWAAADIIYYLTYYETAGFTGPIFSIVEGFRAVTYTFSSGEDEFVLVYCMLGLADGELVPPRYLLRCPGFAGIRGCTFENAGTLFPTWDDLAVIFEVVILEMLIGIINEWTTGFAEDYLATEISGAGDTARSLSLVVPVITDTECMSFTATLNGSAYDPALGTYGIIWHPPPEIAGIGNTPDYGLSRNANRSADALEGVAMSRIEVSANNGDSMFSIVGGTRAESDGGP